MFESHQQNALGSVNRLTNVFSLRHVQLTRLSPTSLHTMNINELVVGHVTCCHTYSCLGVLKSVNRLLYASRSTHWSLKISVENHLTADTLCVF